MGAAWGEGFGTVKVLFIILGYLCAVLLGGALLAPPLYWGAHMVMDAGWLLWLKKYAFQKYFNRSLMVAAVVCLPALVRSLGMEGWKPGVFRLGTGWGRSLGTGLVLGAGAMGLLAWVYVEAGFYAWKGFPGARVLGTVLVSAVVVGLLEEALFRGVVAGLVERARGSSAALWGTSGLFAVVHFLKPDPGVQVAEVGWLSGLELVPHMFHQFARPLLFLGGFGTLLVLGLLLGWAVKRTGSLWWGVGFHAGLVLVKGVFSKGSERLAERLPWVGAEMQVGLLPVCALLIAGGVLWWRTRPTAARTEA